MAYEAYATPEYYKNEYPGELIPEGQLEKALRQASRHVDALTFNRIVGRGFSSLTEYQQEIIREVVCQQADFETENADMIASVLSSYSINGVSMQFGRQGCSHEARCVRSAVPDGSVLPVSEVSL